MDRPTLSYRSSRRQLGVKILQNSVYCTAPWNGLTVREDGNVKTCCIGQTLLGNLKQQPLADILKNKKIGEIKQSLLDGRVHPNCAGCEHAEQQGFSSIRQYYLKHYPEVNVDNLSMLDIRWNNTCNLSCVYCNPQFSSKWAKIAGVDNTSVKRDYNDELLEFILDRADTVGEILLVGGEPLLMKPNHVLFKQLPENTRISMITNLTVDLDSAPFVNDLLNRPAECILWNISLEHTHEYFEYIRNGGKWSQIEKNLRFLNQHWPHSISFEMVYNVFSALQLDDTIKTLHGYVKPKITLQDIGGYNSINLFNMPNEIQQLAKQKLLDSIEFHNNQYGIDAELYSITNAEQVLDKIGTVQNTVTLELFEKELDRLDRYHTHKCREVFSKEYTLIKNYLH